MHESRRTFLGLAFGAAATAAVGASAELARSQQSPQQPPIPNFPPPLPRRNPEEQLKANQASIKKDVTRLSELVDELQKGLDNNDTKEVLSLDVIHKTEEIEKLAKQIRDLLRG